MELVKILRNGQVTLPSVSRKAAQLEVGDFVKVEVEPDGLKLKPIFVMSRKEVKQFLMDLGMEESDIQQFIDDEIKAERRQKDLKGGGYSMHRPLVLFGLTFDPDELNEFSENTLAIMSITRVFVFAGIVCRRYLFSISR